MNIAELLKDCPTGMELDSVMFDNVTFVGVNTGQEFPIEIKVGCITKYLTKEGCYHRLDCIPSAKCVIFPKGKTTWEGFQRPFKDGDVVITKRKNQIFVFKENAKYNGQYYCGICHFGFDLEDGGMYKEGYWGFTRLATEEEKQKFFDAIKANGYKWNPETKTLEKLIEPKFKVGDRITNGKYSFTITHIVVDCYHSTQNGVVNVLSIEKQDEWKLEKFDITTLKGFESKVLVRNSVDCIWKPAIFGFRNGYNDNAFYIVGGSCWKQYIPYNGNEHLLGTTNDCDEYYKTWE